MYEAFFGLRNRPFSPLPRVDSFIPLAPLREPLDALIRCVVQEQGIGVLTASPGSGKSLICRMLQSHFQDLRRTVLLTTARFPTRRALLQAILFELKHPFVGLSEQEARLRVLDLLQSSPAPLNRMLLIVDEAHLLSSRGLEELRTLTDYEVGGTPCVSLILSGQLELEELLTEPAMNAFNQRVGCHVCIEQLTFEESSQYLRERLRIAGNDGLTVFTPEAIQLICTASEGNPRRLNQLSDHSLLLGYAEEECPVDVGTVRSALLDLRELPLHWNAPLDLTGTSERNPLEAFAESYDAESLRLPDEESTDIDTVLDVDEGSDIEEIDAQEESVSKSSVFEVGATLEESPIDQLFQVTRFIVPGESSHAEERADTFLDADAMPSTETHAFETEPPEPADRDENSPGSQIESVSSDELPGLGFEFGGELVLSSIPANPDHSTEAVSPMGFEELVIDDAYAKIDRLRESNTPIQLHIQHSSSGSDSLSRLEPDHMSDSIPDVCLESADGIIEDLGHTLIEENQPAGAMEIPSGVEGTIEESQPVFLEEQLLELIHQLSQDIHDYRSERDSNPVDEYATLVPTNLGNEGHPTHNSLRQALNWQFDVVEPETEEVTAEPATNDTLGVASTTQKQDTQEPQGVSEALETEPVGESSPVEARPYAQLFSRLQRQRRRVEAVMHRERRTGPEARKS